MKRLIASALVCAVVVINVVGCTSDKPKYGSISGEAGRTIGQLATGAIKDIKYK